MIQTTERNAELKRLLKEDPRNVMIRKISSQFLTEEAKKMWAIYKMKFQYGGTFEDIAEKYAPMSRQRAEQIVKAVESTIEKILA